MPNEFVARRGLISSGSLRVSGSVTASFISGALTGTFPYSGLTGVPTGIISSSQVVSSSQQIANLLPPGTVSSSTQVDYNSIQNKLSGVISSSTQFNALSGTSASFATTASFAANAANGLSGGTTNYIPLWTSATVQSSSNIFQNAGNIGIGTTTPTLGALHVVGKIYSTTEAQINSAVIAERDGYAFVGSNSAVRPIAITRDANPLNNPDIIITTAANVGIGTLTPEAKLHVQGNVSASSFTGSFTGSHTGTFPYASLTGIPSGIVSSSTQIQPLLPAGTVSASVQIVAGISGQTISPTTINGVTNITASFISGAHTGTFPYSGLTGVPAGIISSSTVVSSSAFSSPSQGTVRAVINGVTTDVDTGLQTGDSPSFSGLTVDTNTLFVDATNDRVGIGTITPNIRLAVNGNTNITGSLDVTSAFTAQTKSFKINHQTIPNRSLIYGVLEGPEHAVYTRGRLTDNNIICLPTEWEWLVDEHSITVQLTSIGAHQKLYVDSVTNKQIVIKVDTLFDRRIDCYYLVHATRKDVEPLQTVV